MANDRAVSTIILVDSADVAGSVGRRGFLRDHLKPMGDVDLGVDVEHVPSARCDIVAQRLSGVTQFRGEVPGGLEEWFATMTDPIEIPDTTSLMILSLSDAVTAVVLRQADTGVLIQPPLNWRETWTGDQIEWIDRNFEVAPPADEAISAALRSIAHALESSQADLMVFNTSTFIPGEKVYWFHPDDPETTSVRAARMNLTVDTLLKELDITLVDVDRVTAELGAREAVVGPAAYADETLDALADVAMGMILDLEGISRLFASDAMQLSVPRYDRRTTSATLTLWHVAPDTEVARGDALFDLRFGNVRTKLDDHGRDTDRAIHMSVVAGRDGYVDSIEAEVGAELTVGTRVAVITATPAAMWDDIDNAAHFPIGVRVEGRDDR
ncbi:MAG: hypothetical protein ABFR53_04350 [Actinomycetota bacterium]